MPKDCCQGKCTCGDNCKCGDNCTKCPAAASPTKAGMCQCSSTGGCSCGANCNCGDGCVCKASACCK